MAHDLTERDRASMSECLAAALGRTVPRPALIETVPDMTTLAGLALADAEAAGQIRDRIVVTQWAGVL